jgi:hypothetical protein
MAKNIWNATLEPDNNVKQNTFDWTHVNNLTTQIGRITPIQCELVPAKTSFRVNPFPALQLMPMVFPIQTRMRATISYFRYPLRALWKDFKDFEGNFREGLEEPYHDFNSQTLLDKMLKTGQLMDYLGVPTTQVGSYGSIQEAEPIFDTTTSYGNIPFAVPSSIMASNISEPLPSRIPNYTLYSQYGFYRVLEYDFGQNVSLLANDGARPLQIACSSLNEAAPIANFRVGLYDSDNRLIKTLSCTSFSDSGLLFSTYDFDILNVRKALLFVYCMADTDTYDGRVFNGNSGSPLWNFAFIPGTLTVTAVGGAVNGLTLVTSPYYNSNSANKDKQIKLSAYAARAYEGIYNSVYRDNRNNPYYIDGVVQYNQWIPSYEGGADSYPYELRYANWEKDFLTTAVQSPQQGNAPLVGITTYEQSSVVTNESGEPTTVKQTKVAMVDEEGKRYSLEFESDSDELKNVKYVELDNGTTVRSARSLFDLVTSGISITDLRNVNAYQKFLELNMRKGYSYKEIIEGRFDVKVRYADLLLPEFFGGFSRDINMNAITQTVDKDDANTGNYKDALGSQAGVGYFRGGTDANIECFCDEESIIMGLLVITPLPVYTQLLPKHFLYRGLLDHFNPEFNNISFQPITYKEVCPIQAYNENPNSLTGTFGYQRAWYEYCQRYDQAHGLFRTDLSNFLMHRVFDQKPELAQSFLVIDPEQVTDVFSVTETTDKVYGQILLDCTVKLPVARVAIPRLD